MRTLAAALVLLFSVPASAGQDDARPRDILWQLRSPDFIQRLADRARIGPGVRGFAWWQGGKPCIIMTAPPPADTAPEADIRFYVHLLNHEIRHCAEGFFHGGGPEKK